MGAREAYARQSYKTLTGTSGVLWRAVRAFGVSLRGVTPISYPHLPLKLNLRARFTV